MKRRTPPKKAEKVLPKQEDIATPASRSSFNYDKWMPLLVAALGFLLYINTIGHGYVFDDETVMAKNSIVTKGISAIPEILTTAYREGSEDKQENLYRPLSLIVFAIQWQFFPKQPLIGHHFNILMYAFTGFVLYKLLRKWFKAKHPIIPSAIALLFIAHPVHTEVVANIKSLDEILALLFALLSMNYFFDYSGLRGWKFLLAGAFCFFLSLLSKEGGVTLAAAIPLSFFFFAKSDRKIYLFVTGAILITVLLYFALRVTAMGSLIHFTNVELLNNSLAASSNPADQFATAVVISCYSLRVFLFPHPLICDYSYNTFPIASMDDPRFLISAVIVITLITYSIVRAVKKDPVAFGILFFGITYSVVSNIFILIEATFADRFLYLPSLGLCIAVIGLSEKILSFRSTSLIPKEFFRSNKAYSIIFLIILLLFSAKTFTRNFAWKDNFTLFEKDKDSNPDSYRLLYAYGSEFYNTRIFPLKDEDPQKAVNCRIALEYMSRTLAITPDNFKAWKISAYCHSFLKEFPQVKNDFYNGIQYYRNEVDLVKFYIMGINAEFFTGGYAKAVELSRKALEIEPKNAALWNCLGMNLSELNVRNEAFDALQQSLKLDGKEPDTWYNLGNWYAAGGDFNAAIRQYTEAIKLKPDHVKAMNNTGNCYGVLQRYDSSLYYYEKVLAMNPNNKDVLENIAVTYRKLGNPAKAQEYESKLKGNL